MGATSFIYLFSQKYHYYFIILTLSPPVHVLSYEQLMLLSA